MNSDKINKWLTLGANIGVVLGLIVLIVEIRQNASLTRMSMHAAKNSLLANIELSLSEPMRATIWVKSYMAPEEMTDVDLRVVESYLVALMLQWDYMFQMEDAGLIPRADVENHIRNTAPFYFGSRFAKRWFEREIDAWQGTEMEAVAGPIIRAVDDDFLRHRTETQRRDAGGATGDDTGDDTGGDTGADKAREDSAK